MTKENRRILAAVLAGLFLTGCSLFKSADPNDPDPVDPNVGVGTSEEPAGSVDPIMPPEGEPSGAEEPTASEDGPDEPADDPGTITTPELPTPVVPDPGASAPEEGAEAGDGTRVTGIKLDKYIVAVEVGKSDMPIVTMLPSTAL
ncbi:MAG: hypothetical protein IKQ87_12605, partial [Clostridia bacterium]|nr:hypothetical protein [Clostridia bacterium]